MILGSTTADVLDTLRRLGPSTAVAVKDDTGREYARNTLTDLLRRGYVLVSEDGPVPRGGRRGRKAINRYALTRLGAAWLDRFEAQHGPAGPR